MTAVCFSCKASPEIVYTDSEGLGYCAKCVADTPAPSEARALAFLMLTVPYRVGDEVKCYLGGQLYEGTGHVEDISFDLQDGGTPIYPAFKVVLDEKSYENAPDVGFYTEPCLRRVGADE